MQQRNWEQDKLICSTFKMKWRSMVGRCNSKGTKSYKSYGAKGIHLNWLNFEEFSNDMYQSYVDHCYQYGISDTTIDRIDSRKDYEKSNCRWITKKEQFGKHFRRRLTFDPTDLV